jgi:hypothetical protein
VTARFLAFHAEHREDEFIRELLQLFSDCRRTPE